MESKSPIEQESDRVIAELAKYTLQYRDLLLGKKSAEEMVCYRHAKNLFDGLFGSENGNIEAASNGALYIIKGQLLAASSFNQKDQKGLNMKLASKMLKCLKGAREGGLTHHDLDRQAFKDDYRAERDDNPSSVKSRPAIIAELKEHYLHLADSTLEKWAKEADKEDGFIRKPGRPKKG